MNILFLTHSLSSGGAERVTANLANHWAGKGWHITIVTIAPQSEDFYELHPAIQRISLNMADNSHGTINALINNGKRIIAIRHILKRIKPQVAIGIMTSANVYLGLARRHLPGINIIGSEHIHPPKFPLNGFWEMLRRYTYQYLDCLVVLTPDTREWVKKYTNVKNIAVIPNHIVYPLPAHPPVVDVYSHLDRCRHYLIAVGRLTEQKGFDLLISAFQPISLLYPDWDLAIVGEGPLRRTLEEQIEMLGLKNRVIMPGRVGNIGDWYAAVDIYVLSSRYEGFGNTLVEAMAYGLPCISFDCDTGPRYIIKHEINGLLVHADDIVALGNSIKTLIADSSTRERLGNKAKEIRMELSIENIVARWERLFEKEPESVFPPTRNTTS